LLLFAGGESPVFFKKLPIASKSEIRITLIGLTLASVALSVGLAILALWLTTSGDPDTLVPEWEIWVNMIFFSALIPALVCPTVVHALLKTLRELHLARAELDAIAHRDPLTGLLNRRGFDEAAGALIGQAAARREVVSALLCDIDHFKRINDTYGHDCGDVAIRHVASVIRATLATSAKVAIGRQGGEEFAVIATGRSIRELAQLAELLRSTMAATPFNWEGEDISLTISLGTSMAPPTEASVKSLLSSADEALYEAKKRGRNRVVQAHFAMAA
jgi:diguanylate cyclase (GGDEF)-like protein